MQVNEGASDDAKQKRTERSNVASRLVEGET